MSQVSIPGQGLVIPDLRHMGATTIFSSALIDASTEKVAVIGRMWNKDHANKSVRKVGYRTGAVALNASSTIKTSLQSVDTANQFRPTGTILGATNNGFVTEAQGTFSANSWHQTAALGEDVSVNYNDLIAVVIEYANFVSTSSLNYSSTTGSEGSEGVTLFTAAWASQSMIANLVLEFSDGTFGCFAPGFPFSNMAQLTYNSGSATDEYGLEFQLPFPATVDGLSFVGGPNASGANFDVVLYSDTTVLQSVSVDPETIRSVSQTTVLTFPIPEQALAKDTNYIVALKPTTVTDVVLNYWDVNDANHRQCHTFGTTAALRSRVDGGAWAAATTTRIPRMGIRVSGADNGVGGGAGGAIYVPAGNGVLM